MASGKGAMLTGGTGAGKTETVKGFAQIMGNFLAIFQCSPHSDPTAIGELFQDSEH